MTKSQSPTGDDVDFTEPTRQHRKSTAGRRLMRWDPSYDQLVLLYIEYICVKRNISIPWDEVAAHINDYTTGEGIKQHLAKVRSARDAHGQPIPPKLGGRKKNGCAVTEVDPKKKIDVSRRSGLLYYPDSKVSKQASNNETRGTVQKPANTMKAVKKISKATNVEENIDTNHGSPLSADLKTSDCTKEAHRGKKRSRGSALEKELQELMETDGSPSKKRLTTKLRAREPVDYSEVEPEEENRTDERYYVGKPEQHRETFDDNQQNTRGQTHSKAINVSPAAYTGQLIYSQLSNVEHSHQTRSDSVERDMFAAISELSPLPRSQPCSTEARTLQHISPEYAMISTMYQPHELASKHVLADRFAKCEQNGSFEGLKRSVSFSQGSQNRDILKHVNLTPLSHEEDTDASLRRDHSDRLKRSDRGQHDMRIATKPYETTQSPRAILSHPLMEQPALPPASQNNNLTYGPMISGWSDETTETMFKSKFPSSPSSEHLHTRQVVHPFHVHVDPYKASAGFAYIMQQHKNGIMPLKGEPPRVAISPATNIQPMYEAINPLFNPHTQRMQRWEEVKAHVASHEDNFDANIPPSQVLPSSYPYHTEDVDLFGFKIEEIHPIEMEENCRDVGGMSQIVDHNDEAAPIDDDAERSDIEPEMSALDDVAFDQLINNME